MATVPTTDFRPAHEVTVMFFGDGVEKIRDMHLTEDDFISLELAFTSGTTVRVVDRDPVLEAPYVYVINCARGAVLVARPLPVDAEGDL